MENAGKVKFFFALREDAQKKPDKNPAFSFLVFLFPRSRSRSAFGNASGETRKTGDIILHFCNGFSRLLDGIGRFLNLFHFLFSGLSNGIYHFSGLIDFFVCLIDYSAHITDGS